MRLPAQLAPNPCAFDDSRLTMPGRSGPTTVTTSDVIMACASSVSETVRRIIGARVAKRSSCLKAGTAAVLARVPDDLRQQLEAHRRERALPQVARGLALADEAPVLRGDRAGVPAVGEVVDGAARDRVALEDRPLDGGDAAVPRQQRRVVADAAQARARERLVADARVRVRGDDEVGALRDRVARDELRVLEHVDRHARLRARRSPAGRRRRARRRARFPCRPCARRRTPWLRNSATPPACTACRLPCRWRRVGRARRTLAEPSPPRLFAQERNYRRFADRGRAPEGNGTRGTSVAAAARAGPVSSRSSRPASAPSAGRPTARSWRRCPVPRSARPGRSRTRRSRGARATPPPARHWCADP